MALFERAAVAAGTHASLSLPLRDDSRQVVGGVNLYATEPTAFDGRHDEIVEWSSRWGPAAAVRRGSMSFGQRWERAAAPERQRDDNSIDRALAMLSTALDIQVEQAADLLTAAARRAGIGETAVARAILRLLGPA